jgi:hypothetical protein
MDVSQYDTATAQADPEQLQRTVEMLTNRIHMLEHQNHTLVEMLRSHGIQAAEASRTALELPPAQRAPLGFDDAAFRHLSDPERRLVEETLHDKTVYFFTHTASTVDVGHWLSAGVVWAAATDSEIVLMAAGRRPFVDWIPFDVLQSSIYNHVTGEVVFSPAPEVRMRAVRLSPAVGYQMLAQIYDREDNNA